MPTPTFPELVTTKSVLVDEPIAKAGPEIPFGLTESCAQGVEVPSPSLLLVSSQKKLDADED